MSNFFNRDKEIPCPLSGQERRYLELTGAVLENGFWRWEEEYEGEVYAGSIEDATGEQYGALRSYPQIEKAEEGGQVLFYRSTECGHPAIRVFPNKKRAEIGHFTLHGVFTPALPLECPAEWDLDWVVDYPFESWINMLLEKFL